MKQVLLIVIDALDSRVVNAALDADELPNMRALISQGVHRPECVSVFPSITPAATASLITGKYPCDHGIAGAHFYNSEEDRVSYFGTDFWAVMRESFSTYFNEFLTGLNGELLCTPTLLETVERKGLRAACINYMIFRGDQQHKVDIPWLLKLWPGIPFSAEVPGPGVLYLGDLVSDCPDKRGEDLSGPGGLFNRCGFQDKTTAEVLLALARENTWSDFTVAYFPDNDFESHEVGPAEALPVVKKVDQALGELIEICGGLEDFLEGRAVMIVGDHSQSDLVSDEAARGIDLTEVLQGVDLVAAGAEWTDEDQLMACPNMRACQFYLRRGFSARRGEIVKMLLSEQRIDQVIWREGAEGPLPTRYQVATADRGEVSFYRAEGGLPDEFGNCWKWEGSLEAVDALQDFGRLSYDRYPNAFERIAHAFVRPTGGDLWATAHPGHEFKLPKTAVYPAGSHGSLHRSDSLSPFICAGLPEGIAPPGQMRSIDVAPLCETILGIA